jgi:hypothetical protein
MSAHTSSQPHCSHQPDMYKSSWAGITYSVLRKHGLAALREFDSPDLSTCMLLQYIKGAFAGVADHFTPRADAAAYSPAPDCISVTTAVLLCVLGRLAREIAIEARLTVMTRIMRSACRLVTSWRQSHFDSNHMHATLSESQRQRQLTRCQLLLQGMEELSIGAVSYAMVATNKHWLGP